MRLGSSLFPWVVGIVILRFIRKLLKEEPDIISDRLPVSAIIGVTETEHINQVGRRVIDVARIVEHIEEEFVDVCYCLIVVH
jgi:hypothetical protein